MLRRTAVKASPQVVEPLADDLATANNNTSVAVVDWREGGLLTAKGQVVVGLDFD